MAEFPGLVVQQVYMVCEPCTVKPLKSAKSRIRAVINPADIRAATARAIVTRQGDNCFRCGQPNLPLYPVTIQVV